MNPFNAPAKLYVSAFTNANGDLATVLGIFSVFCSGLILWIFATIFIPGIVFVDHLQMLIMTLMVDPIVSISTFFMEFGESMRIATKEATQPVSQFSYLLVWIACKGLSLIVYPMAVLMWLVGMFLGYVNLTSGETKENFMLVVGEIKQSSVGAANIRNLMNGRTTIEENYEKDVQANAIVEAFKKFR